jgi:AcrR family transcriptional regulator
LSEPKSNRWRGVPAEERAAGRRALLVDVGFELVGRDGMAGTTVRKVCEAAHLNPRYFYESFPDLDALLVAVFDRTAMEAVTVMFDAVAGLDAAGEEDEAVLRVAIGSIVRHVSEDPRRARILFMEGLNSEALGQRRWTTLHEMASSMVADAQAQVQAATGEAVPMPSIVTVAANLMVGGMAELVMSFVMGHLDVTLDELVEDTTALFTIVIRAVNEIEERTRATRTSS